MNRLDTVQWHYSSSSHFDDQYKGRQDEYKCLGFTASVYFAESEKELQLDFFLLYAEWKRNGMINFTNTGKKELCELHKGPKIFHFWHKIGIQSLNHISRYKNFPMFWPTPVVS